MLLKIALCNRHLMDLQVFTGGQTQVLLIPQCSQTLMPLLTPMKRLYWTAKGTVLGHWYISLTPPFFWEYKGATLWLAECSEEICLIAKAIRLNTNHDTWIKEREKGASSCITKKALWDFKMFPCMHICSVLYSNHKTDMFYTFQAQATCFDFVALGESLEKVILLKALLFLFFWYP